MRRHALVAALLLAAPAAGAQQLNWMSGCWERRTATGVGREEWRTTPVGLDGGAATYRGDTLTAWEFLRVAPVNGRPAYIAAPNGQPAHAFPLVASSADTALFADPAHDFPQRITYRRVGRDSLHAHVAGGGNAIDFRFARVTCDASRDLTAAVALRDTLQGLLDSLKSLGRAPGLSAAVALPDGRAITLVSGVADSTGMRPLTAQHRLLAGSVGKTFFAALALNLVAEGKLDLDAKISTWLGNEPWFARLPNGADITVRQLMNHTSGLVRYEFDPEFAADLGKDPLKDWQVAEQLSYILGDTPPFAAGAGWEYSDTNYLVMALIVEKIIGGEAYAAIRTRFLAPRRLRGTTPSISTRIPGLANGYGGTPDPLGMSGPMIVNGALKMNPKFEWAGGGYASTPEDLARWAQAWYNGTVIPAPVLTQALDGIAARALGQGARYGLGVIIRDTPRGVTYGHSGFFPGYLTEMRYYPGSKIAVAVMANTSDGRAIGRGLAQIAHVLADRAMGPAR
jgi:D-alanyl-D-alanine carboxypeptidase